MLASPVMLATTNCCSSVAAALASSATGASDRPTFLSNWPRSTMNQSLSGSGSAPNLADALRRRPITTALVSMVASASSVKAVRAAANSS